MRVLAVSQVYAPDHSAVAQLLTQMLEDIVAFGDEVTVIASRRGYLGGAELAASEIVRGVRVIRPWATSFGKASVLGRLSDYGSFWATSLARAMVETRADVLLALTTPPMIASGVLGVSAARRIPMVTWVQDVYPDLPIKFGMLKEGSVPARALRSMQRATYRHATLNVALSDGMAEHLLLYGATAATIRVIRNWSDGKALAPIPREANTFRRAHGLEDRFVAMYSGNLGVGHDVATFVDAARRLARTKPEVVFLFIGDGVRRREAEDAARGLPNVRFLPYQPEATVNESLAAADVHLISLREDLEGLLVPSKLYAAMAVGRPIMFVGPATCEVARVVQEHGLGWSGRPGDGAALAAAISAAADDRQACRKWGECARRVFEERFDRPLATRAWHDALREASAMGSRR